MLRVFLFSIWVQGTDHALWALVLYPSSFHESTFILFGMEFMMRNIQILMVCCGLCLSGCGLSMSKGPQSPFPQIEQAASFQSKSVFKKPESVLFDPVTRQYFVSNVNGHPLRKDGNGFISKVALNGEIRDLYWLTGLNAPKGMTLIDDTLYIADIDELIVVDITTAQKRVYPVQDALFLNDITHDSRGVVYISDFFKDIIYAFEGGHLSVWMEGLPLQSPNGLHVIGKDLYVGNWGRRTEDFKTEKLGDLLKINLKTHRVAVVSKELGNLDGVEHYADFLLVTDYLAGTLSILGIDGQLHQTIQLGAGAADLCVPPEDWEVLVVPMLNDNRLQGYTIRYDF